MSHIVGIQGGRGSYHEKVANTKYPHAKIEYIDNFAQVFNSLLVDKSIESAIVAIANNRYGFIQESYSEILDHTDEIKIIDEYTLSVKHQLLAIKGTHISELTAVYSQNAAIGQCTKYINQHLQKVSLVEHSDTAAAAKFVASSKTAKIAAIASTQAAQEYNLEVIASNIQDDPNNLTRFLIIQRQSDQTWPDYTNKTTAILTTSQEPGSLADCLNVFKEHDINITNLHSSFVPNTDFEMQFFVEFDSGSEYPKFDQLIKQLEQVSKIFKIIGSYRSTRTQ